MTIEIEVLSADQRCPCMLVLDTSGSMLGDPIEFMNQGLGEFERQLKRNTLAARRIEVGIVSFGNGGVRLVQPFVAARHFAAPALTADGKTPMGEAVTLALQTLRTRKNEYRSMGIQYYRPWLMLITDGEPTDAGWEQAAAEAKLEESRKAVTCFAVGVGATVNYDTLHKFSSKKPLTLQGLDFEQLFVWLSGSLGQVSASSPGDQVELLPVDTWAQLN
jgi:uncharacterized protein YegL